MAGGDEVQRTAERRSSRSLERTRGRRGRGPAVQADRREKCRLGATRRAGPGSVLGVWVVRHALPDREASGPPLPALPEHRERPERPLLRAQSTGAASGPVFLGRCCAARPLLPEEGHALPLQRAPAVRGRGHLRRTGPVQEGAPADQLTGTRCSRSGPWPSTPSRSCGRVGEPARDRRRRDLGHLPARLRAGDPMRESPRSILLERPRPHAAADLLREAPATTGRHGLRRAEERDAHARRQRRPGRGRHDSRRDRRHRLEDQAEPGRGAGRRRHVAAARHHHPFGHHRQPGQ